MPPPGTGADRTKTTYGYDSASHLTGLLHPRGTATLVHIQYVLHANGNGTQETSSADGGSSSSGSTSLTRKCWVIVCDVLMRFGGHHLLCPQGQPYQFSKTSGSLFHIHHAHIALGQGGCITTMTTFVTA